ncbi:hypothetical protein BPT24_202 [Tenacibaculum phage pT24]|uniref:Uncharacterized protein n=1 Tax=Tenacibaculum phage pT24 TaxID=1880590 RepID=A0A1B4XWY4_9CAUD|nr:hypothetical protein HYP10_gp202 [Tenacibaculum phage pT24]BAV39326.1 hypothetical protein BPT24_202 [Tenacibaculum phage pT24]
MSIAREILTVIEKTNQIALVVADEHTIGYIVPECPNKFLVLRPNLGSWMKDGSATTLDNISELRLLETKDFEEYKLCGEGYIRDTTNYYFNR